MTNLKPAQQLRSARLLAILTQAFAEYPRAHMILQAYSEGIGMDGSFQAVRGTSGFEALRLLAKEFSLRSRAEAAFFRSEFMSKTFKGTEVAPTQISDLVRQMDVGLSKYRRVDRYLASAFGICGQDWFGFATGRLDVDVAEIFAQ